MEKFKEILNDLIIEEGSSLKKIAEKTCVQSTQYSRYLKGTIPTLPTAIRISNYFNCSLDYLFGVSDQKSTQPLKKDFDLSSFIPRYEKVLKENKTTHWKFCKEFKLSESILRKWKKGQIPNLTYLTIIAKELSTSIDYLIGRC